MGSRMETRKQTRKKSRRQARTKTEKEGKRIKDDTFSNLYIFWQVGTLIPVSQHLKPK